MNELSKDELRLLIEKGKAPSLSIYLPTHKAGAEVQQNAIRLKNLLKEKVPIKISVPGWHRPRWLFSFADTFRPRPALPAGGY